MTTPAIPLPVLITALAVTGVLCATMVLLVVAVKTGREVQARRRANLLAPYRQDLIVVSAGEDHDDASMRRLAGATGIAAAVVDDAIVGLLGKIRGAPAEALVRLLVDRGKVAEALSDLSRPARGRRARAAHLLGMCRQSRAVPHLVAALGDKAGEVRAHAAHALGMIGDAAGARPVLRAVGATDPGVPAGIAAAALLSMGVEIADALRAGLADPDPRSRTVAARVSGAGSFVRSRPRLRALLADDHDLTTRTACAEALGMIGGRDDVAALGRHTQADAPLPLRRTCATALGELGEPAGLPALTTLLDDPDPRLAELAAAAMLRLSPQTVHDLAAARGVRDQDPRRGHPLEAAIVMARLHGAIG
ncbi:HEAT repeat domain-containing protein [Myceligenerans indicum]|uniref:HEAT repeat domain-containing protein n=1 Tax=Myceligenerans indicum TaxID=2593663 RepID=A0ABS1LK71_9MICO|nr:HEAT repeat domain-containing protein [Myceligenerans indicum]MBL0886233.1 hypothetical protein [Myceligenerans indicum]